MTLEASPIQVDGTLDVTGSYAGVHALDAATGALNGSSIARRGRCFPPRWPSASPPIAGSPADLSGERPAICFDPDRLWRIDGKAKVPAFDRPTFTLTPLDNPTEVLDPKTVALRKAVSLSCAACHGRNLVSAGGPAPDLSESPIPLDAAAFRSVVRDGALIERRMPRFDSFTTKQMEGLRQYIRSRARAALAGKAR